MNKPELPEIDFFTYKGKCSCGVQYMNAIGKNGNLYKFNMDRQSIHRCRITQACKGNGWGNHNHRKEGENETAQQTMSERAVC